MLINQETWLNLLPSSKTRLPAGRQGCHVDQPRNLAKSVTVE